jgi:hypothetical protein
MSNGLDDNDNDVGNNAADGSDVVTRRPLLLMEVLLSLLLLCVCCQHCLLSRHMVGLLISCIKDSFLQLATHTSF